MMKSLLYLLSIIFITHVALSDTTFKLSGSIIDADTKKPIAARMYIQRNDGKFFFATSTNPDGTAIPYDKQAWNNENSKEKHVTLSAHPYQIELPIGKYTITVEKGKEYLPYVETVEIENQDTDLNINMQRWTDMNSIGWYSGETHVHRTIEDLPTLMLAEDLNVTFPLTYWVTKGYAPPTTNNKAQQEEFETKPQYIDDTHVIYPLNTEYEIFTIDENSHTLGAVFCLNHKTVFTEGVPPVKHIAEKTHSEGGLLELDKHNWQWSMMLIPVMGVDLFELTNNHIWRTEFAFRRFGTYPPSYMDIELDDEGGMDEESWIYYGFMNYYALLNCGFRMRPTAGTASGVHPVPLGFGRVYVHIDGDFTYEKWVDGLNKGHSFVTTGPLLDVKVNNELPGSAFEKTGSYKISGNVQSIHPIHSVEVIVSGNVYKTPAVGSSLSKYGTNRALFQKDLDITETSWIAVRCVEKLPNGRIRFAHSAPVWVDVEGKPLYPKKEEAEFLVKHVQNEIDRNKEVLKEDAMEEYYEALRIYQNIAKNAR